MMGTLVAMFLYLALLPASAEMPLLPDDATPGAINPAVTQENIDQTICQHGWAETVRPPSSFTGSIKRHLLAQYLLPDPKVFELDHRVPIEVGGCPDCKNNLWLQRWSNPSHHHCNPALMDAACKDRLENFVHKQVCTGQMTLAEGQSVFLGDWIAAYQKLFQQ